MSTMKFRVPKGLTVQVTGAEPVEFKKGGIVAVEDPAIQPVLISMASVGQVEWLDAPDEFDAVPAEGAPAAEEAPEPVAETADTQES